MKNMKFKINLLLVLCLSSLSIRCQTVINMSGDSITYPQNYLSTGHYYIKDINNYLDNFTGTWEYINGNEKFQIILVKVTFYHVVHSDLNLDFYEDGIIMQYKKFLNDNLIYESPIQTNPAFDTKDGISLNGYIEDFERLKKTIYYPFSSEVLIQGGQPIIPKCIIDKINTSPQQIKFNLYLGETMNYDTETYEGQSTFSIPSDITMTKMN